MAARSPALSLSLREKVQKQGKLLARINIIPNLQRHCTSPHFLIANLKNNKDNGAKSNAGNIIKNIDKPPLIKNDDNPTLKIVAKEDKIRIIAGERVIKKYDTHLNLLPFIVSFERKFRNPRAKTANPIIRGWIETSPSGPIPNMPRKNP